MDTPYLGIWASKKRQKCKESIRKLKIQKQLSCKHEDVADINYHDKGWLGADPPFRVCKLCGFAEEGWFCGYQILRKAYCTLDRKDSYKYIEGGVHNNRKFVRVGDIFDKEKLYKMAVTGNG